MTISKTRLTITVDPQLLEAGQRAVADGRVDSVSAWVNAAIEDKVRRDQKLDALKSAIVDYEREFGEISAAEIASQKRSDMESSIDERSERGGRKRTPKSA